MASRLPKILIIAGAALLSIWLFGVARMVFEDLEPDQPLYMVVTFTIYAGMLSSGFVMRYREKSRQRAQTV